MITAKKAKVTAMKYNSIVRTVTQLDKVIRAMSDNGFRNTSVIVHSPRLQFFTLNLVKAGYKIYAYPPDDEGLLTIDIEWF